MESIKYNFKPRWKEELVCSAALGSFIVEMTMGEIGVYIPDEAEWKKKAPNWAIDQWSLFHTQIEEWCNKEKIPLYLEKDAWIVAI